MLFLFSLLCIYLGFLVLPRGFKAQYCRGSRRRYRRKQRSGRRRRNVPPPKPTAAVVNDEETPTKPNNSSHDESIHREEISHKNGRIKSQRNDLSSAHSLVKKRLVNPGLRLIAHGIKVRPRPVWVQLHMTHPLNHNGHSATTEFRNCLTWRAELKSSPSQQGNACELGSLRKVSLNDILGFEVGQKTVALRRLSTERSIRESECFSILTVSGTLDLQCVPYEGASAENVRDAILDCLAGVLSSAGRENVSMLPTRTSTISTVSF